MKVLDSLIVYTHSVTIVRIKYLDPLKFCDELIQIKLLIKKSI